MNETTDVPLRLARWSGGHDGIAVFDDGKKNGTALRLGFNQWLDLGSPQDVTITIKKEDDE